MTTLNLKTQNKQEELVKAYLEENASSSLANKINHGTPFEKDGKPLINKKTLAGFMKYALEEARKLAGNGATGTYVDDPTVYGWAIHYFEEDSIEGTLYTLDGAEYKPAPKPIPKSTTTITKQPEKPIDEQRSLFDMIAETQNSDTTEQSDDDTEEDIPDEEVEEMQVNDETDETPEEVLPVQTIPEKPKGNEIYRRYVEMQDKYPDCVIALRLGDFYEILGQNAVNVAKELDITLTGRDCGLDTRVPMVGFPYHVSDNYIAKLIDKGYKVAIVESLTDVTLKQKEFTVDKETGEILSEEQDEQALMKNYHKASLLDLLELFGSDATIG